LVLSSGVVDVPNFGSSHTLITPRGGGVAVVLATTLGVEALSVAGAVSQSLFLAVVLGGGPVALIEFLDDRYSIHPSVRS
jgi:Fuc2NAc and GlcNAc transferase